MPPPKNPRSDLIKLLEGSPAPMYLLDSDRRIVYCNAAALAWTECKAEELVGLRCDYHSQTASERAAAVAAGLCPPPDVFSGERRAARVSIPVLDGGLRTREGEFLPLVEAGEASGLIAVLNVADTVEEEEESEATPPTGQMNGGLLHERVRRFRHAATELFCLDRFIGNSPLAKRARAQAALAATSGASVLIVGPPGSGKEHLARSIHYARAGGGTAALVTLRGADLSLELFRSIVGPLCTKGGGRETPAPATLLVLDADQIAIEIQLELHRLLAGGSLKAAMIATASRSLEELAAAGQYRHELACALGTLVIELASLAKRAADLPLLAQVLLEDVNARGGKQVGSLTSEALDQLAAYQWPGNLDELAGVIAEAHSQAAGPQITPADLPKQIHLAADAALHPRRVEEPIDVKKFLQQVEQELIQRALRRTKGNKSRAARLLGLTRPRLYRRMVQLGLAE